MCSRLAAAFGRQSIRDQLSRSFTSHRLSPSSKQTASRSRSSAIMPIQVLRPSPSPAPEPCLQRALADSITRSAPLDEMRILIACGAKVNAPVTLGLRPLHYAVWQRYPEAARWLLTRGCDVNAADDLGHTPLHLCAEKGYSELAALFLEFGARVDFTEMHGGEVDEPLRMAIKQGHMDIARMLLQHGANPNASYFLGPELSLLNPLDLETAELLLQFGADPNAPDRAGLSQLMRAARQPDVSTYLRAVT